MSSPFKCHVVNVRAARGQPPIRAVGACKTTTPMMDTCSMYHSSPASSARLTGPRMRGGWSRDKGRDNCGEAGDVGPAKSEAAHRRRARPWPWAPPRSSSMRGTRPRHATAMRATRPPATLVGNSNVADACAGWWCGWAGPGWIGWARCTPGPHRTAREKMAGRGNKKFKEKRREN